MTCETITNCTGCGGTHKRTEMLGDRGTCPENPMKRYYFIRVMNYVVCSRSEKDARASLALADERDWCEDFVELRDVSIDLDHKENE